MEQLEKLKGLLAHSHPNLSTGELIAHLAKMGLERLDPMQRKTREKKVVTAAEVKDLPKQEKKRKPRTLLSFHPKEPPDPVVRPSPSGVSSGNGIAAVVFGRILKRVKSVVRNTEFKWTTFCLLLWAEIILLGISDACVSLTTSSRRRNGLVDRIGTQNSAYGTDKRISAAMHYLFSCIELIASLNKQLKKDNLVLHSIRRTIL